MRVKDVLTENELQMTEGAMNPEETATGSEVVMHEEILARLIEIGGTELVVVTIVIGKGGTDGIHETEGEEGMIGEVGEHEVPEDLEGQGALRGGDHARPKGDGDHPHGKIGAGVPVVIVVRDPNRHQARHRLQDPNRDLAVAAAAAVAPSPLPSPSPSPSNRKHLLQPL